LNINALFESLFAVSDSALIDASFDGFIESRSTDSHQNDDDFIERAIHLSSVLVEAAKRSARKRSSVHNASVWPLSPDLTINVFSMLDTQSLFCAGATCSFFKKCAIDPLCYININLGTLTPKIKPKSKDPNNKDDMVSKMIQRAGSALQSIKLGVLPPYISDGDDERSYKQFLKIEESPFLTGFCLSSLSTNGGVPGSRLRSLHLYRIKMKDETTLSDALSASLSVCHSLVELKFVGMMDVYISRILECVSRYCRLLEHFIFEFSGDCRINSICEISSHTQRRQT
ncbi:F-box protein SKIP17-like, partial [Lactuca sativa]|uniref:F-box protein SKIP17-like n=1 Tax=Lactuca sativa TaxID=4236 RepID=UPI0022B05958